MIKFINKFSRYNLRFKNPQRSDIVIYDEANSYYIKKYILNDMNCVVYNQRPETININIRLIINFLITIPKFCCKGLTKNTFSKILDFYRVVVFNIISPKIVITMTDNKGSFCRLYQNYKKANYFAIQNGRRLSSRFNPETKIVHEHYFCFGQNDMDLFNDWGYSAKKYHPIGSFRSGISTTFNNKLNEKIKYDICLTSIWRPWKYNTRHD